jgi:hypothetical protein
MLRFRDEALAIRSLAEEKRETLLTLYGWPLCCRSLFFIETCLRSVPSMPMEAL